MARTTRERSFDQLRAMAVFAKTIELGSFRAAARALELSPSVVSHHVANLEAALDVALLYRTTRRLTLTDAGRVLFEAAREMSEAAERGLAGAVTGSRSPAGKLRVALPAAMISESLLQQLAAFALEHPRVSLSFHASETPVDLIGHGIDVAIRAGTLADSSLKSKKLLDFHRTLVAAPGYVAARAKPRHPRDVAAWDWLALRSRPAVAVFARDGVRVPVAARITADSAATLLALVRCGLGLAMVPTAMARAELDARRLVEVLPTWPLETLGVYAVWPANAPRSGLALRLIGFLDERLRAAR
ncbi:MAG: LysR family transcriptional regulator [Nannocystaceae bacterium]